VVFGGGWAGPRGVQVFTRSLGSLEGLFPRVSFCDRQNSCSLGKQTAQTKKVGGGERKANFPLQGGGRKKTGNFLCRHPQWLFSIGMCAAVSRCTDSFTLPHPRVSPPRFCQKAELVRTPPRVMSSLNKNLGTRCSVKKGAKGLHHFRGGGKFFFFHVDLLFLLLRSVFCCQGWRQEKKNLSTKTPLRCG